METSRDQIRSLLFSLGVHFLLFALITLGLTWTRAVRPVSAAGPVIEATLVSTAMPALPKPKTTAPKPTPKPDEPKPKPAELPPILPEGEDRKNQEKIDRMALEKAQAEKEQEEKIKREQRVLEQEQRLTEMDRQKREQLEDIRRKLEAAEKKRKEAELALAKIEEKNRKPEVPAPPEPQPDARAAPGNEGTDTDLLARYSAAIQAVVIANWLRPDSAQAGLRCNLDITQIVGGEVIEVHVVPPCNADELTRRSIEAAVQRAQPLPYNGYEKVFQRKIRFNFHYDG